MSIFDNSKRPKPTVLIIADGLGVAPPGPGNAVTLAKTQYLDQYWYKYPHCYLHASGSAVGLPSGTNGNSEVGHTNIGAGKVVFQDLPRIDNAIANQTFFANVKLIETADHIKKTDGRVHLIGLCSPGKVHSTSSHIYACLRLLKQQGLQNDQVIVHVFTDGRDTPQKNAVSYIEELESEMERLGIGVISTIIGRFYAMDRDERWERTKMAYDLITSGNGKKFENWKQAMSDAYSNGETDEFITPRIIIRNEKGYTIKENDSVLFFNFRPDRSIQLTKAFLQDEFTGWQRNKISNLYFVGMNEYEEGLPEDCAFPPENIALPIGRLISDAGLRQLRIAESEKFPHVTYFFNGGNEIVYPGEDRIEIPSRRDVATYDLKPEMSAYEVNKTVIEKINQNIYDFIIVNFANPDMVGHTGNILAAVNAVQVTDQCIGKLVDTILMHQGAAIIIADHGNVEEMINLQTGQVDTEHSTNPVPFIFISNNVEPRELSFGILADVAPTILHVMGIQKPSSMTGRNLLV